MRGIVKMWGAVSLGLLLLFMNCNPVSAKNYYDVKYGNLDTGKPYKKLHKKIAEIRLDYYNEYASSSGKDFNGDGKKEKVVFSASKSNQEAEVVLEINNRIVIDRTISGFTENISFQTMKIRGKCIAVLLYGDGDYAWGGALIYLWKGNQKLKLLKSYQPKEYLDVYVGKDKTLKKDVLYIEDTQQFWDREKWTSNIMKKYKQYANETSTSVTKSTYHKFVYRSGVLEKVGKDNYFRVGVSYD